MEGSTPRWRRSPQRRPTQVIEAAIRLFARRGYEQTMVQDIAGEAGVSVGTVYRYFASKEHVLEAIHERFHEGLEDSFRSVGERLGEEVAAGRPIDGAAATAALVDATADYLRAHRTECRIIASYVPRVHGHDEREAHDHRFIHRLAVLIRAGVEAGVIATSDPEMTAHLVYYAMRDSLTYSLAFGDPSDTDRLVRQTKEMVAKTLARP